MDNKVEDKNYSTTFRKTATRLPKSLSWRQRQRHSINTIHTRVHGSPTHEISRLWL